LLTGLQPLFAVDLALKDVGHAINLAESTGAKLPGMEIAKKDLQSVKDEQGAKGDISGIYGASRKASGLNYKNGE
jgi:3-hydroxyisobutyrate dehydrogenase-like beta-hydroxyacid dehydrogenase